MLRVSLQSVTIRDNLRPIALLVVIATAIGRAAVQLYELGVGLEKVWGFIRNFDIDFIANWQSSTARGRGTYLYGVEINAWSDLIWNIPLRVLFFLGSPFIWMVSQFRDVLGLLDAIAFLYISVRITWDIIKRRVLTIDVYLSVLLVVAGVLVLFALATSNYGTAFRHRAKVFPWLLLLYLYGNSFRVPRSGTLRYRRRQRLEVARRRNRT